MTENLLNMTDREIEEIENRQSMLVNELARRMFGFRPGSIVEQPKDIVRLLAQQWAIENGEDAKSMDPMRFATGIFFICKYIFDSDDGNASAFHQIFFAQKHSIWPMFSTWEDCWLIIGAPSFYEHIVFSKNRAETSLEDFKWSGTRSCSYSTTTHAHDDHVETIANTSYQVKLPNSSVALVSIREDVSTDVKMIQMTINIFPGRPVPLKNERVGARMYKVPRELSSADYILPHILPGDAANIAIRSYSEQDSAIDFQVGFMADRVDYIMNWQVTTCEPSEILRAISLQETASIDLSDERIFELIYNSVRRKMKRSSPELYLLIDGGFILPPTETIWSHFDKVVEALSPDYEEVWIITRIEGVAYKAGSKRPLHLKPHHASLVLPTVDSNHD